MTRDLDAGVGHAKGVELSGACAMYTGMAASYRSLLPYEPPPWAKGLKLQPTSRVVVSRDVSQTFIKDTTRPTLASQAQHWIACRG